MTATAVRSSKAILSEKAKREHELGIKKTIRERAVAQRHPTGEIEREIGELEREIEALGYEAAGAQALEREAELEAENDRKATALAQTNANLESITAAGVLLSDAWLQLRAALKHFRASESRAMLPVFPFATRVQREERLDLFRSNGFLDVQRIDNIIDDRLEDFCAAIPRRVEKARETAETIIESWHETRDQV